MNFIMPEILTLAHEAERRAPWLPPNILEAERLAVSLRATYGAPWRPTRPGDARLLASSMEVGAQVVRVSGRRLAALGPGTLAHLYAPGGHLTIEVDENLMGPQFDHAIAHECGHWLLRAYAGHDWEEASCEVFAYLFLSDPPGAPVAPDKTRSR